MGIVGGVDGVGCARSNDAVVNEGLRGLRTRVVDINLYCIRDGPSRTYQIVGDYTDESVTGIYTNCSGGGDSFSFFGGPGTVGYICALAGSVYVTSGNGSANDVGGC